VFCDVRDVTMMCIRHFCRFPTLPVYNVIMCDVMSEANALR
jgi:hypothetical protein